jgi:hypothetical protein
VRLDRDHYQQQIADALAVLGKAKEFGSSGYEIETVRITTQRLGELVAGIPEDKVLTFGGSAVQIGTASVRSEPACKVIRLAIASWWPTIRE